MDYDQINHLELTQRYKSGANWFYWIAGLTIVTSVIAFFGGGIRFLISLGLTQIIDGLAEGLATELGSAVQVIGLMLDLFVTGIFVLFGYFAGKKVLWVYVLGMVVFLFDGLLALAFKDAIGVIAHAVVLFWLFRGYQAGRELVSLEKVMAEQATATAQPQPEPAI
jgi:hypothetical protein